jgi:hypothetical protein
VETKEENGGNFVGQYWVLREGGAFAGCGGTPLPSSSPFSYGYRKMKQTLHGFYLHLIRLRTLLMDIF